MIYAGPATTRAGVDDIVIQIPPGTVVPDGCYVPLSLVVNQTTVTSTISKTNDGSPCNQPLGLTVEDAKLLDSGQNITTATIAFNTRFSAAAGSVASRTEWVSEQTSVTGAGSLPLYLVRELPAAGCAVTRSSSRPGRR